MFEDSTKAVVISSSHIKGPGPRIGSIGYAIPYQEPTSMRFLSLDTQFINGLVLSSVRMIFIKYGYEKERAKHEVKNLIGIIPIVNELRENSDSEHILRTYIEKFPKSDFNNHLWLKAKLGLLNKMDNIDICVLAPVNTYNSDLKVCSGVEFSAWFRTLMFKDSTRISIHKIINNNMYLSKLPERPLIYMAEALRGYFGSRNESDNFVNYVKSDVERRETLIKLLRLIKPFYSKNIFPSHKKHMKRLLTKDRHSYKRGTSSTDILFCKLSEFMFIDEPFNWKLDLLSTKAPIKNRVSIAAKLKKTKEVLESMANEINEK